MQLNQQASGPGSRLTDAVSARAGAHYGTLAAGEDENWVCGSAGVIDPGYTRALADLSRCDRDATVVREFDMTSGQFVDCVQQCGSVDVNVTLARAESRRAAAAPSTVTGAAEPEFPSSDQSSERSRQTYDQLVEKG
jgi:hypothetical protein